MRVALLHHGYGTPGGGPATERLRTLAGALRAAGHEPHVLSSRAGRTRRSEECGFPVVHLARLPDGRLRSRGFDAPLTHAPALLRQLRGARFDAVHAFTPEDAAFAARAAGRVFLTPLEPPRRETLAARRLRLRFWDAAVRPPNVLVVEDEAVREAVRRWLAVDAAIAATGDAPAHERIYRDFS